MSKSKQQGTALETWLVKFFTDTGFGARRIAEGGSNDEGDVLLWDTTGSSWTIEAKAREVLNVTRELEKARTKAPKARSTLLIWKRLVKKEGKQNRGADGTKVVVVMGLDTLVDLLEKRET